MSGLFIVRNIAALLFGGAHSEGASFHFCHIKTHAIHVEGFVGKFIAAIAIDNKIH